MYGTYAMRIRCECFYSYRWCRSSSIRQYFSHLCNVTLVCSWFDVCLRFWTYFCKLTCDARKKINNVGKIRSFICEKSIIDINAGRSRHIILMFRALARVYCSAWFALPSHFSIFEIFNIWGGSQHSCIAYQLYIVGRRWLGWTISVWRWWAWKMLVFGCFRCQHWTVWGFS